ncbi:MAG: hypothetical protein ACREVG_10605 [Burkholderiales bacterium]
MLADVAGSGTDPGVRRAIPGASLARYVARNAIAVLLCIALALRVAIILVNVHVSYTCGLFRVVYSGEGEDAPQSFRLKSA